MEWLLVVGIVLILLVLVSFYLRPRNLRATAEVFLHPAGPPEVSLWSRDGRSDELVRLGLAYAAKLRWVLVAEPREIREIFDTLFAELCESLQLETESIIDRMPTAREIRGLEGRVLAAPRGERFMIRYYRTSYKSFHNTSSIVNTLPRPGLATNLVWNYIVLMEEIHRKIDPLTRERASRAFGYLWQRSFAGGTVDRSLRGLKDLVGSTDYGWELSTAAHSREESS